MRKKCVLTILLLIVLSFLGYMLYLAVFREKNVFDQMYYTRVHTDFDVWNPGNYRGMFANMEQLNGASWDNELSYTQDGYFKEYYKTEYLGANESLEIAFYNASTNKIFFSYVIGDDPTSLTWYCYSYNVDDKTLTYDTNDPDNTENKEFLYTIVLRDWFEANPDTRFSMEDLGDYEFIDESDATDDD